jgi:nucleoside-diphosphate kinase
MKEEKALVIIKPDGLIKSLTGNIITALSETKLKIVGAKIVKVSKELAEEHYSGLKPTLIEKHGEEKANTIFENILKYMQGEFHTPRVFAMVYSGENAINKIRDIVGETNPEKAKPITLRGKYGRLNSQTQVMENVIHCSDSSENAKREIELWFNPEEIVE